MLTKAIQAMNQPLTKKRHIRIVESARGIAGSYVAIHHVVLLFNLQDLLPHTDAVRWLLDMFLYFAIDAVILFFLLSGFSIHYVSVDRLQWNAASIRHFYYLRWRRIYPIFLLAVALALLALVVEDRTLGAADVVWPSLGQWLATPFFLVDLSYKPGYWFATLSTNGPLWSLSYEVIYYLIYPLFWLAAKRTGILATTIGCGALSLAAMVFGKVVWANHLSNVMGLYLLWCLGALLAEIVRRDVRFKISALWFFPVMLLLIDLLWVFESMITWRLPGSYQLLCGAAFFLAMLLFQGGFRENQWPLGARIGFVLGAAFVSALFLLLPHYTQVSKDPSFYNVRVVGTGLLTGLWLTARPASAIWLVKKFLAPWHSVGAYSYGIYVLHYPLLIIALNLSEHWLGSKTIALLAIPPIIYLARWVELRLQPRLAGLLDQLTHTTPKTKSSEQPTS